MISTRRIPDLRAAVVGLLGLAALGAPAAAQTSRGPFRELDLRSIGPAVMGGRIHDVQALPNDPSTVYIAAATGGLWKSTNHGTTWTPIFDHEPTATFGVIAIAPSDSNVLWAGTGEQNNRQSSSWGNGVYRSTNAGATWTHVGLDRTRAIGRIVVDPHNPA
ncbi:MAG: WD40/YVTN/BNR-like repeat-containing protein, partial [Gemmatimonadaceae bacterium]